MKPRWLYAIVALIALALPASAWAQQQDLEVTIRMVPADAAADAATRVIKLPDAAVEARAQQSPPFGHEIANKAHEMRGEFGRDIGTAISDQASKGRARPRGTGRP
jgi:hypothetical protein